MELENKTTYTGQPLSAMVANVWERWIFNLNCVSYLLSNELL